MSSIDEAQPDLQRLDELISQLMEDDEATRYDVARQIAKLGQPIIPRMIELAEDSRPRMREMACYILGQVGYPNPEDPDWLIRYPDGIPTLLRHLESDSDPEVRATAAYALGFHAAPSALPHLCRATSDHSESVRLAAAHALGSFYESAWETEEGRRYKEEVTATLLRLMDDEDEDVRDWATFGIHQGDHDTPAVRARLWKALDDPNPEVRGEAAWALGIFGDRSLIPRLEKLLREDEAISPNYFEAARELGDPALLPAVLDGAERWHKRMKKGEDMHFCITWAIEELQKIARGHQEPAS